ncbi:MAG TPA: GWxTD domain-containing protein [candidate division Zixibacteria bacterium]
MRIVFLLILFCFLGVFAPLVILAQTDFGYIEEKEQIFFTDCAAFREDTGEKFRVEVYYKILTKGLTFVKEGDKFKTAYEVQVFASNKITKERTGTSMEEHYTVNTYEETRSPSDFLINQVNLFLYSGRYKLRIKLIDQNSGSTFEEEKDLNIPSRNKDKILFSDIEFIRQLTDSITDSRLNRKGYNIIPSVSRSYGDTDPILRFYFEIYGESQSYLLRSDIEHRAKDFHHQETTTVVLGPAVFSTYDSVNIEGFPSGDYYLTLELLEKDQVKAKAERTFQIEWSFFNLLKNDFAKAIDQLRYVASSDEMKKLKAVPEDKRMQAWLEFWKSKDPTPNTPENELKDEYYRRLKYVNQNFTLPTREGWETDMGMVYMVYGPPDDVERHPFDRESQAFQKWYYYKNNRVFLFMDRGDGEYLLQPPYDGVNRKY